MLVSADFLLLENIYKLIRPRLLKFDLFFLCLVRKKMKTFFKMRKEHFINPMSFEVQISK